LNRISKRPPKVPRVLPLRISMWLFMRKRLLHKLYSILLYDYYQLDFV
jgi:hypothetical protein